MAFESFPSAFKLPSTNLQEIEICIHGTKGTNQNCVNFGSNYFCFSLKCFIIGSCVLFEGFHNDLKKSPRNLNLFTWCQGYKYHHFGNLEVGLEICLYFSNSL